MIFFNPSMDKKLHPLWSVIWNYLSIPKVIQVAALQTLLGMWLLIHTGIKVDYVDKNGPWYVL